MVVLVRSLLAFFYFCFKLCDAQKKKKKKSSSHYAFQKRVDSRVSVKVVVVRYCPALAVRYNVTPDSHIKYTALHRL